LSRDRDGAAVVRVEERRGRFTAERLDQENLGIAPRD
jgi:hypothetical protein